jgi:hypothetical protein
MENLLVVDRNIMALHQEMNQHLVNQIRQLTGQPPMADATKVEKAADGSCWFKGYPEQIVVNEEKIERANYVQAFPKKEKYHEEILAKEGEQFERNKQRIA